MRLIAVCIILCSLLFTATTYAADKIISPLPDPMPMMALSVPVTKPQVSFGDLLGFVPDTSVVSPIPETTPTPIPTPLPTSTTLSAPTPTPTPIDSRTAKKRSITVSLVGDSMIDTLGPVGSGLAQRLNAIYPNATFTIINHGVGAENIDSGLRRLTNSYSYMGLGRNAVISEHPDVVVIESFGYNPFPQSDINDALTTHWLRLAAMVDTIRQQLPESKIVIAATIAPNWDVFGDGAPGIAFTPEDKRARVDVIKKYLENTIAFAKSQNLPLANAYNGSLDNDGNGLVRYINAGDHIHYSDSGRSYFSQIVANSIISNRLLE